MCGRNDASAGRAMAMNGIRPRLELDETRSFDAKDRGRSLGRQDPCFMDFCLGLTDLVGKTQRTIQGLNQNRLPSLQG